MFTKQLLRVLRAPALQTRNASSFNKFPTMKVKPFGVDGNVMLAIGTISLIASTYIVQKSGYLIPQTPGVGFNYKKLDIDLTTPIEPKPASDRQK
uniref:Uncharacterized protein n=1 Tax=Ciona intestinalis TaxID=7719 RepID=F7AGD6_CIOIN